MGGGGGFPTHTHTDTVPVFFSHGFTFESREKIFTTPLNLIFVEIKELKKKR